MRLNLPNIFIQEISETTQRLHKYDNGFTEEVLTK